MKNLEQIKNEYAVSKGFTDWDKLVLNFDYTPLDEIHNSIDEVMKIYAMECLKLASDRLMNDVDKFYINNENNIIK